ncbi:MAG: DUF4139 domain-containing protein, partial [Gammaproteobacteria bacterium]|nr:DUF4139 domain-containing protein [Gammaproteobacteria bacterium]
PDRSTKQLELFPRAGNVPCRKQFVFSGMSGPVPAASDPITERQYGAQVNDKVSVFLVFDNEESANLGVPLPKGRVRVNKLDLEDGSLQFIGEASIDHTPRDDSVSLLLGSAFDIRGKRTQVDFRLDQRARWITETVEIQIRNQKDTPVTVAIRESMYRWANWSITQTSHDYTQPDARTIEFGLPVPARGQQTVTYTVRYSW